MKYEVKTQQGKTFIVSDDSVMLWIHLERDLGKTMSEAYDAMGNGSVIVVTYVLWRAMKMAGHTETMTPDAFVEHELESFDPQVDDPKDEKAVLPDS